MNDYDNVSVNVSNNIVATDTSEFKFEILSKVVLKGKWFIIFTTLLFAFVAVAYALSLPNIYKSDVLLVPSADSKSINIPGQLGGLAALADVNLQGGGDDKSNLALEIIKSRDFLGSFIEKYDILVDVMASKGWDRETKQLIIDDSIYDVDKNEWVRDVGPPYLSKPSKLEVYDEFVKIFNVTQEKTRGVIELSIEHHSPYLAMQWLEFLVKDINDEVRRRDLEEASASINYLNKQLDQTNLSDARSMLFTLIEEQTKTIMLANVRSEYVFKVIDRAVLPEEKYKPKRLLIVLLITILGLMLSVFIVLIRFLLNDSKR